MIKLEEDPASSYIRGPATLQIPATIWENERLIGWKWTDVRTVDFLKGIPKYDPFVTAKDYYFDCEEWSRIIAFIVNECTYPEAENTGLPFIPEKWQSAIYANLFCWKHKETDLRRYRECFILVPRKNGKELRIDEKIPTPTGFTCMGDLEVGDTVFDKDGYPTKIVYVSDVRTPAKTYKITFANGTTVEAGADHQWHIYSRVQHPKIHSKAQKVNRRGGVKTVANLVGNDLYESVWTTQEMVDTGTDCWAGKTFAIKMHSGVQCADKRLHVDPYILGAWLGDGHSSGPYITCGDEDVHMWAGRKMVRRHSGWHVVIKELRGTVLADMGVKNNKHIPEEYFTASWNQRMSLLQGLMDTDGTINKRGTEISISQINKQLAYDIYRLCYSLGLKASIKPVSKACQTGVVGTYYLIQFAAGRNEHPVFRLKRKLDRMRPERGRSKSNHIVSIEPCTPSPMKCIQVDSPSGTYLFGEQYLPTHNTSAFGAIISLIMFFVDKEKRAQNFCCAADIEQASNNFRHCQFMIETNPRLVSRLRDRKVYRSTRSFEHIDGSLYKVLSSVADTKHGLSPNFVYIDEVHAHPNRELIDVLITGTGARRQPLIVYTTTADYDRPSVCNTLYEKAKSIATDKQWEPTFLPVLYEAELSDDFRSEAVWRKANPNYGVSINRDYFERLVRNAQNNPVELNRFLRLHLNIRTKTETAWIPSHIWSNGNPDPEEPLLSVVAIKEWMSQHPAWCNIALDQKFNTSPSVDVYIARYQAYWSWFVRQVEFLQDEECYAGFDNASVKDIASLNLWFPRYGVMLHWGWCPAVSIYQRSTEQNLPYSIWWEAGLINSTSPLDTVDEPAILRAMLGDEETQTPGILTHFKGCREVCFDRWGSHYIYTTLKQYGYPARAYPQSFAGMNEPCRRMEALVTDRQLFHGGHPVLDWMVSNVVVVQSRDGQIRPDRSKSTNKIDGIVAGLMSMGSWLYPEVETITEIRGLK